MMCRSAASTGRRMSTALFGIPTAATRPSPAAAAIRRKPCHVRNGELELSHEWPPYLGAKAVRRRQLARAPGFRSNQAGQRFPWGLPGPRGRDNRHPRLLAANLVGLIGTTARRHAQEILDSKASIRAELARHSSEMNGRAARLRRCMRSVGWEQTLRPGGRVWTCVAT
jgi:hypothetical protein